MGYLIVKGFVTLFSLLFGIRLFCIHYIWGQCKNNKSLRGKTVIVTGANSGIGKETAIQLVSRGARVILACRDEHKALQVIEDINRHKHDGHLLYKHIDLQSFASVSRFVDDINNSEEHVHILVNNAGVFQPPFGLTVDGFETQFQVNHLSNALLTLLLLPKLKASSRVNDESRIVMLTSTLYKRGLIRDIDFIKDRVNEQNFGGSNAYANSKLANILFSTRLSRSLQSNSIPVNVYLASPGIVWTNLNRHVKMRWWQILLLSPIGILLVRSAQQGCQTVLHCAIADSLTPATLYRNCSESAFNSTARDPNLSKKVYDMTFNAFKKSDISIEHKEIVGSLSKLNCNQI